MLIFSLLTGMKAFSQVADSPKILHFTSSHTAFPDAGRANGHLYDSVLYTTAEHYTDNSVMLVIPPGFVAGKKIDLVFWFHGWRNNIDTAAVFYGLTRQFCASKQNAVLVLAETAKNAPDSYGGKLEQAGVFKGLVDDVMKELKAKNIAGRHSKAGNIVLGGHSGAYRVIANILKNGEEPVKEVFLFDALYAEVDKFMAWIQADNQHHFVHWFTNKGGGTDVMSDTMMKELNAQNISYQLVEEASVTPAIIKNNKILFIHSLREHNVIINNPDDFELLLENSWCLKSLPAKK
ncbi:MAG TPA: hypothetical protein VG738_18165 [Chitinophagaceae bacterium]|nr:hypothetical protein [Chitinophagaceae bacterium]